MEAHMALKHMRKELASGEVDVSCIRTQECGGFFKWAKTLSEQQLIDCARGFDNHGCHGGLPSHAFSYIHWQGGQDTENSYPYQDGGIEKHPKHTCRWAVGDLSVVIDWFVAAMRVNARRYNASKIDVAGVVPGGPINITAFDEDELFEAVATMWARKMDALMNRSGCVCVCVCVCIGYAQGSRVDCLRGGARLQVLQEGRLLVSQHKPDTPTLCTQQE